MESNISTTGDNMLLFLYPAAVPEEEANTNLGRYDTAIANNVAINAVFNTSERSTVKKDDHHMDRVEEDDGGAVLR
jgi:hypothetical protein